MSDKQGRLGISKYLIILSVLTACLHDTDKSEKLSVLPENEAIVQKPIEEIVNGALIVTRTRSLDYQEYYVEDGLRKYWFTNAKNPKPPNVRAMGDGRITLRGLYWDNQEALAWGLQDYLIGAGETEYSTVQVGGGHGYESDCLSVTILLDGLDSELPLNTPTLVDSFEVRFTIVGYHPTLAGAPVPFGTFEHREVVTAGQYDYYMHRKLLKDTYLSFEENAMVPGPGNCYTNPNPLIVGWDDIYINNQQIVDRDGDPINGCASKAKNTSDYYWQPPANSITYYDYDSGLRMDQVTDTPYDWLVVNRWNGTIKAYSQPIRYQLPPHSLYLKDDEASYHHTVTIGEL